jgi:surfactin synthase thioesterase subunit
VTPPRGRWLRRHAPRPDAALRLLCLPHGGGGASGYAPWGRLLPPWIETVAVQYPGREDRWDEPGATAVADVVAAVAEEAGPLLDRPYALFGHSMGAAIAYELAHALTDQGRGAPVRLFASGHEAPQDARGGTVHLLGDDGLAAELDRLGGTDAAVLSDPALRTAVLERVRADYRLAETWRPRARAPLSCPVSVFLGADDPDLEPAEAVRWAAATSAGVETRVFPGGHFYLVERRDEVVAAVAAALGAGA